MFLRFRVTHQPFCNNHHEQPHMQQNLVWGTVAYEVGLDARCIVVVNDSQLSKDLLLGGIYGCKEF